MKIGRSEIAHVGQPAGDRRRRRHKDDLVGRDQAGAGALFTADATYREMPFDAPIEGAGASPLIGRRPSPGQDDILFSYEILACAGDEGICHWHCAFTGVAGGEAIDLDGIFRWRFADVDHVSHFQEWWHVRVVPPAA